MAFREDILSPVMMELGIIPTPEMPVSMSKCPSVQVCIGLDLITGFSRSAKRLKTPSSSCRREAAKALKSAVEGSI